MSNKAFPRWKYWLLFFLLAISFIYAAPNLYGEDPVVQISGVRGKRVDDTTRSLVQEILRKDELTPKSIELEEDGIILVRFHHAESQMKAKDLLQQGLGEYYSVALNLVRITPRWLEFIGAKPMKLGLDLRGGVHFLMEVDIDFAIQHRVEDYYQEIPKVLKANQVPYRSFFKKDNRIVVTFATLEERNSAYKTLSKNEPELLITTEEQDIAFNCVLELSPATVQQIHRDTVEQTLAILRNRVNELGVAEAVVQRQGINRIVVELPGIQDTSYARDILGKTATLKFLMEDYQHPVNDVLSGKIYAGSKVYYDKNRRPILLKTQAILTGTAVTGATTGQDRDGNPAVNIRLSGDISLFSKTTQENIGRKMAVLYSETQDHKTRETVISLATIQSALGNRFQITGLNYQEARDLALLLRAGALPVPVSIVEESIVGPSMGQENIRMGMISVGVGLALVLIFMALYYSVLGMVANIALFANLILLIALMSLIGATLTLPGIAGIVLTLGMAVDANVLIFERIREELRLGLTPKASIHHGFECAFATIIDSNLTTLIVGIVLFAIGTGPVKGFAVTLCIGILTSLITATTGTRAMIELLYGRKTIKKVKVGV